MHTHIHQQIPPVIQFLISIISLTSHHITLYYTTSHYITSLNITYLNWSLLTIFIAYFISHITEKALNCSLFCELFLNFLNAINVSIFFICLIHFFDTIVSLNNFLWFGKITSLLALAHSLSLDFLVWIFVMNYVLNDGKCAILVGLFRFRTLIDFVLISNFWNSFVSFFSGDLSHILITIDNINNISIFDIVVLNYFFLTI